MAGSEQKAYKEFIAARKEVALQRLRNNLSYAEWRSAQKISEGIVEKLLHKLEEKESAAIRHHYEGEIVRENFELDEVYLQGMRDCIQILSFLDVFHREVYFDE